jgi:hypothetical protein
MEFNLFSPTRGIKYILIDVLNKFLERRGFKASISVEKFETIYEGGRDYDGCFNFEVSTLESQWTNSVDATLVARIPFHVNGDGKAIIGIHESFPMDGPRPEYYSEPCPVSITATVEGETDTVSFDWQDTSLEHEKEIIISILKEAIIREIVA